MDKVILKSNTAYMLRDDGKLFKLDYVHPYIIYNKNEKYSIYLAIQDFLYRDEDALVWFYKNTNQIKVREKIQELISFLYIVMKNEDLGFDKYSKLGLVDTTQLDRFIKEFNLHPRNLNLIEEGYTSESILKLIGDMLEDLNCYCNQEFLRIRVGGSYNNEGNNNTIYCRISSVGINWFNYIWELAYFNQYNYNYITIIKDYPSGKTSIIDDYYVVDGELIKLYPIEDFINLKGKPLIEYFKPGFNYSGLALGKRLDETFGDYAPAYNLSRLKSRAGMYFEDNFLTEVEYQDWKTKNKLPQVDLRDYYKNIWSD